jgi:aromatic-L-amino-acid/L-tryptophan decarboxylase
MSGPRPPVPLTPMPSPGDERPEPLPDLDWPAVRVRELAAAAIDLWVDTIDSLDDHPVSRGETESEVRRAVLRDVPEEPLALDELTAHLRAVLVEHGTFIGHPRFLAYIVGSGTAPAAVADLLAAGLAPNVGGWLVGPAATEIERALCVWLARQLGLPAAAGGLVVTGGAIGNLVGLKLARDRLGGDAVREHGVERGGLAVYASAEAHDTVARAADILGLGSTAVRSVPVDDALRLRVDALNELVARDQASGVRPLAVVGTAGTTGTGSIDPLPALAELCVREGAWFHVDAAYGGPAVLAPDLRDLLEGIEHADSITVDAHKWLYTPTSAGIVIVRDERHLAESFSVDASYVYEDRERTGRGMNTGFMGPAFSRSFDALKIWLTLLAFGRDAVARRISHDAALARWLGARVAAHPDFELAAPVSLSICCFRYRPRDLPDGEDVDAYVDELNRRLLTELQLDGRVFPSNAVVHGRFVLRTCIVNVRTEADDLDALLDVTVELGVRLDRELRPSGLA